jgi:hypothetical protein
MPLSNAESSDDATSEPLVSLCKGENQKILKNETAMMKGT